jgi:para-aminobenzoate synthetase component 1
MTFIDLSRRPWRDPLDILAPRAETPFTALLLSDASAEGRWSYFVAAPDQALLLGGEERGGLDALRGLLGPRTAKVEDGPPFQGGVVGVLAYEFGARLEPLALERDGAWPDLAMASYRSVLAFDHERGEVMAVGRGVSEAVARRARERAEGWLDAPPTGALPEPPADTFEPLAPPGAYEAAVADTTMRIARGELYQANIARRWAGALRPGAGPFDAFRRLVAASPAPFSAYLRLPGRALVSHSPERFLKVGADGRTVQTQPIKGTRPRGRDPASDGALARELKRSAKDRAENLMIVDLMRNDLSRVCEPGSVEVPDLFAVESFAQVHHLVSTVRGRLAPGRDAVDLIEAAFPPGSITGAPKPAAMARIAALEPPRGAWCGSLFWAGVDGAFDSSVLIRTAALTEEPDGGWRFRASAGAGIVADSEPRAELAETEAKISGLRRAFTGKPKGTP